MIGNLLRTALFSFLVSSAATVSVAANAQTLALVGGKLYPSPDATPISEAVVLASNGVITAIGSRSEVQIPADARVIDCTGKTVVAGFWNSHVHFTEGRVAKRSQRAGRVAGRTYAGDADAVGFHHRMGSRFRSEQLLAAAPPRQFGRSRRVPTSCLPATSSPRAVIPPICRAEMQLPEAATPEEATQMSRDYLGMGLDGIKLFTGAFMGDKPVVNMDVAIAKAAVDVAHAQGKPVFAHPQNKTGVETVIAAGSTCWRTPFPANRAAIRPEQLARFKSQGIALIPTLSLFTTVG